MTSEHSKHFILSNDGISTKDNRVEWIDNLKGFILLLVCINHLGLCKSSMEYLAPARMTTFFFLSGLLFNDQRYSTIKSYITRKYQFLFLPYLRLSLLFLLFPLSLYKGTYTEGLISKIQIVLNSLSTPEIIQHYILTLYSNAIPIISGNSTPDTESLWFVFTLFLTSCVFYVFNYYVLKCRYKYVLYTLFPIVCITIGWVCNNKEIILPFRANVMFTSLFFYQIGFYSKAICKKMTMLSFSQLGAIVLLLSGIYHLTSYNTLFDLHFNMLGDDLICFLVKTISGIFLFSSIFILISRYDSKNILGIFRYIARNALIILCTHYYLLRLGASIYNGYLFTLLTVVIGTFVSIPLFRNKLYWFIGKEKISLKESLDIFSR